MPRPMTFIQPLLFTCSPEVLMTRTLSILSLLAGILLISAAGGCASTQPHGLAGREPPSTNINARYPTLPPM